MKMLAHYAAPRDRSMCYGARYPAYRAEPAMYPNDLRHGWRDYWADKSPFECRFLMYSVHNDLILAEIVK